jgi:hypothetical protein
MSQLYSARITAPGQQWDPGNTGELEDCPVGTVITSPTAWRLCLTFFRNTHIAEPADDVTAAKVAEYRAATQPAKDAAKAELQSHVNAMALNPKIGLKLLSNGQPERSADGEIKGKLTNLQRHRLETALAYGITPQVGIAATAPVLAPVQVPKTEPEAADE